MSKVAVRNVRLCTKDCLCLYVCPTGASDTENSVIDVDKCIGCGACAEACPSKAISMVPREYPPQQEKTAAVRATLNNLAQSKVDGEKAARQVAEATQQDGLYRLMQAVAKSQRLIAEDALREAGYMLPQSNNAHELLNDMLQNPPTPEFPAAEAEELLARIPNNESIKSAKAEKNNHHKNMEETKMAKFVCMVCGYVHEGDAAPEACPVCKAPAAKFVKQDAEMTWAAEHVVGVAQGSSEDIMNDLRANFTGECTEVGMYLAMARVAHREGYPEIGMYYEKAAYEEAEHAAKFAELLGEVITDSTKKNLELRIEAENGATAGKTDLAKRAKAANLDAIHDTVHEMARDEARHGKAFKGLHDRYFGK